MSEHPSDTESDTEPYLVPGLVRGIRILRMFRRDRPVISAPEMAHELGIPRSTVFRLVQTLEHLGLLERVAQGQGFRTGIGVLALGYEVLGAMDIAELGRPFIDRLSAATGLASHLVIRDGASVVVVYKTAGSSPYSSGLTVGSRLPAHATALGRMTLIDTSEAELQALYGTDALEAYSAQTPTSLAALRDVLSEDRRRGHAISDSSFEPGIASIAAPVRDRSGKAFAAININQYGPLAQGPKLAETVAHVVAAAAELSTAMSYRPDRPSA